MTEQAGNWKRKMSSPQNHQLYIRLTTTGAPLKAVENPERILCQTRTRTSASVHGLPNDDDVIVIAYFSPDVSTGPRFEHLKLRQATKFSFDLLECQIPPSYSDAHRQAHRQKHRQHARVGHVPDWTS